MVQPAVQTACSRRLLQCAAIFHRVSIKTSARAKRRVSRSLLNGQGVASFGGHGAESRMSLIRSAADSGVCCSSVLQRPQRQLLSQTRLNFSTLKIFFSSLTAVEPKAQSGRSLFFHYRTFLSGLPPKKDLACQTDSQRGNTEVSVCSRLIYVSSKSPAAQS